MANVELHSLNGKFACFTGHRPDKIGGYDEDNDIARGIKDFLRTEIAKLKAEGYVFFISGMALGVDQWAAEIVLEDPGLKLIAAIPCKGQEARWPKDSQDRYNRILGQAFHLHYVAESYSSWCMQVRNEFMVDMSSVVVAIWDGTKGGTANCLKYAQKLDREIRRYSPKPNLEE